ncbi:hypothetical protein PBRA_006483 [Plasmodiophora brassicae]|nr:hypothetical protein PBRA_006483 [Plasmodiophora brassicae]
MKRSSFCSASLIFDSPTIFPNSLGLDVGLSLGSTSANIWNTSTSIWTKPRPQPAVSRSSSHRLLHLVVPSDHMTIGDLQATMQKPRSKTIRSFNARLNGLAQKGHYNEVLAMIQSVKAGLVDISGPLNTYTYTILVKSYCNGRNLTAALDLLEQMKSFPPSQQPNRFTYNTIINACVKLDEIDQARSLFRIMEESEDPDLEPDHVTYTTLMKGLSNCGRMEEAEHLLHRLKNHQDPKCRPNQVTYNTMLKGYSTSGDMDAAELMLVQMRSAPGCHPDIVSMNTIIGGYARLGNMKAAEDYVSKMSEMSPPLAPNAVTYQALIDGYVRVNNIAEAERLFHFVSDPTQITYHLMISAYLRVGDLDMAAHVFEEEIQRFQANGQQAPSPAFAILIGYYAENGMYTEADRLRQRVKGMNKQPTQDMYNALIAGCLARGDLLQAESYYTEWKRSLDRGCQPNRATLHMLLEEYVKRNQIDKAESVLALMGGHPDPTCRPNHATYAICAKRT